MSTLEKAKEKMNDLGSMEDAMRERLDMLMHREENGSLSDRDRDELQRLRQRMGMKNGE